MYSKNKAKGTCRSVYHKTALKTTWPGNLFSNPLTTFPTRPPLTT
jgi:hypothetical protein